MSIGLGTYAFFWRSSSSVSSPLSLADMLSATAALGVTTFQICDYPALEGLRAADLARLNAQARSLGLTLELGVRGIRDASLREHLARAQALGATLIRSMLYTSDDHPSLDESESELTRALPAFEDAGVTLALETYEQVATADLAVLVDRFDSPRLGICLDVANTIARLEDQGSVVDRVAERVANVHVKDFRFVRAAGLVGFELTGAELGRGLLDLDRLIERVRPFERGVSTIVEHWLPWQGSEAGTIAAEEEWTARSLAVLQGIQQAHKSTG
jgi:sugar phosphate isomerase/epimerase